MPSKYLISRPGYSRAAKKCSILYERQAYAKSNMSLVEIMYIIIELEMKIQQIKINESENIWKKSILIKR